MEKQQYTLYNQPIFWFKYDLDRSNMHHMINLTGVQTQNLKIMTAHFHIPKMLTLTTGP